MPGSDQKINYQLRPAKSIERKMICALIRESIRALNLSDVRYIGLGAKYFVDFILVHNEFDIEEMVSIEAQIDKKERYDFNKPLKCIQMMYGKTKEMLPQLGDLGTKNNLIWLDYDGEFAEGTMDDIETIMRCAKKGSIIFFSWNSSCRGKDQSEKQETFMNNMGRFFDEKVAKSQYTNKRIPQMIRDMFYKQVEDTLVSRNKYIDEKLEFYQIMFLEYQDGARMMTVGGVLVDKDLKMKLENSQIFSKYVFSRRKEDDAFVIEVPKLTNKEIQLILKNIPLSRDEYETIKDEFHGIDYEEIQQFQTIYKYYPYYNEGQFNT